MHLFGGDRFGCQRSSEAAHQVADARNGLFTGAQIVLDHAHQRRSHDYSVGNPGQGFDLLRVFDAKAHRHRQVGFTRDCTLGGFSELLKQYSTGKLEFSKKLIRT